MADSIIMDVLADILEHHENLDKISVRIYPQTRNIKIEIEDLDDEWFNELKSALSSMDMKYEFRECSVCAAKPGSPILCESCLANRQTIERLKENANSKGE